MSLIRLAFSNFKRSVREYRALVISLSFSIFIFFNFQNVIYSDSMEVLQTMNKDYIDTVVQAATLVFSVFLFFFIWYATNVFLNQRKREIGIYTFMGLDNSRIGKMYALEAVCMGIFALAAGLIFGVGFSKLFQMLLLRLSDIDADVKFSFSPEPLIFASAAFLLIYFLMILKGYLSLTRSSVLDMLSGAKQAEMKKENPILQGIQVIFGVLVLLAGFYCALRTGDVSSLQYGLAAVILVIAGTYLVYGGAIPAFVKKLTRGKDFLYQKQRVLWVNNLAYRVRQNYRMYAMVTILMISSVTLLAMSMALKQRYEKMVHFRETYTYQVISMNKRLDYQEIEQGINKENKVLYGNEIPYLMLDSDLVDEEKSAVDAGLVSYSALKQAAEAAGLPFEYEELKPKEVLKLSHVILMSFLDTDKVRGITINGEEYSILSSDSTAYLGDLQRQLDTYVLSDEDYEKLRPLGIEMYLYNYKIENPENAEASRAYLNTLTAVENDRYTVGVNYASPNQNDITWIRIFYSLCVFMFVTLILAGGSIIFIKLNNDAYVDRQRYQVLRKIGIGDRVLYKSIKHEIRFTYYCPFVMMVIASWFSVKALGNVMKEDLILVNVYSAVSILLLFTLVYLISVRIFKKKVLE